MNENELIYFEDLEIQPNYVSNYERIHQNQKNVYSNPYYRFEISKLEKYGLKAEMFDINGNQNYLSLFCQKCYVSIYDKKHELAENTVGILFDGHASLFEKTFFSKKSVSFNLIWKVKLNIEEYSADDGFRKYVFEQNPHFNNQERINSIIEGYNHSIILKLEDERKRKIYYENKVLNEFLNNIPNKGRMYESYSAKDELSKKLKIEEQLDKINKKDTFLEDMREIKEEIRTGFKKIDMSKKF
jgi:hypothetical protein